MFATRLLTPFATLAFIVFLLAWLVDETYAIWIIPFLVITALVYILSAEINWWWYTRHPPVLEPDMTALLQRYHGFYQRLSPQRQQQFGSRIVLFRMGTDWEPVGWPEDMAVPPNVELAIAAQAVTITFEQEQFLFRKFEKVIVHPQPFASPEFPFGHASELFEEDGCLLFAAEQVMLAFTQPGNWYNIALHEYARAYIRTNNQTDFPVFDESAWDLLAQASNMPRGHIESVIGIVGVEALPVAIHHYFTFPEAFRGLFDAAALQFDEIFKIK